MNSKIRKPGAIIIGAILLMSTIACLCSSPFSQGGASPAELTEIAGRVQQTQTASAAKVTADYAAAHPSPLPSNTINPSNTPEPSPTVADPTATTESESAAPVAPSATTEGQFTMQVEKSTNEFYCKSDPKKVTFTLRVSNINLGFAIYYHFEDVKTGKVSPNLIADIHRDPTESYRTINLVGDPTLGADYYSVVVALPAGMGPSKLVYEIIADDNSYRTAKMEDVTFYPCSYVKP